MESLLGKSIPPPPDVDKVLNIELGVDQFCIVSENGELDDGYKVPMR
jgi:hypothetical protein